MCGRDWSSDVCSSDLNAVQELSYLKTRGALAALLADFLVLVIYLLHVALVDLVEKGGQLFHLIVPHVN